MLTALTLTATSYAAIVTMRVIRATQTIYMRAQAVAEAGRRWVLVHYDKMNCGSSLQQFKYPLSYGFVNGY